MAGPFLHFSVLEGLSGKASALSFHLLLLPTYYKVVYEGA